MVCPERALGCVPNLPDTCEVTVCVTSTYVPAVVFCPLQREVLTPDMSNTATNAVTAVDDVVRGAAGRANEDIVTAPFHSSLASVFSYLTYDTRSPRVSE